MDDYTEIHILFVLKYKSQVCELGLLMYLAERIAGVLHFRSKYTVKNKEWQKKGKKLKQDRWSKKQAKKKGEKKEYKTMKTDKRKKSIWLLWELNLNTILISSHVNILFVLRIKIRYVN